MTVIMPDDMQRFCEKHGFRVESRHGWLYLRRGKQVAIEYHPASGRVTAHRISTSRYEAPTASYQVADWSGVEAIIRSRVAWMPKTNQGS